MPNDPGASIQISFAGYVPRHFGNPQKLIVFTALRDGFHAWTTVKSAAVQKKMWKADDMA
jgi:hypothetical protein